MLVVGDVQAFLETIAPARLAAEWDNVGLLLGDRQASVRRVMTCLTISPDVVAEAVERQVQLVVAHHPLPFRPLGRITTESLAGRLVWELARGGVAVCSAHTAYDSATTGINQQWAVALALQDVEPLEPLPQAAPGTGHGRQGRWPAGGTLQELAERVKELLKLQHVQVVGDFDRPIRRLGVACGSGGEFLAAARRGKCDCLLTGEARFHTCVESQAEGPALLLVGHYASERPALERLAEQIGRAFGELEVFASARERDPLVWL